MNLYSQAPFLFFVTLSLGPSGSSEAQSPPMKTLLYHGIRPTDPGGRNGLRNPERGWRIETLIAEKPGGASWGPAFHLKGKVSEGYSDDWWVQDVRRYAEHGLTLAQTYCYLDSFLDGPISQEKLDWLQKSFDVMKGEGIKAVLRFAYERDMDKKSGPTLERILAHMEQLAPLVRKNADVIFVMQAGFVGAWGEWHSSAHEIESDHQALAQIVVKLLTLLPEDRMTQVRVPKYKRWVLSDPLLGPFKKVTAQNAFTGIPASRIGFNNDGFLAGQTCGGTWTEAPLFSNPGNPEFDCMTRESPFVPVDGELFWADQGGEVDGLRAAIRMRLHHYASFSIAHSFSEREGKPYSIDDWLKAPLSLGQVQEAKLPASDGYFEDDAGAPVSRTPFDYIRDHLGYRIELQKASFPEKASPGKELAAEIELINRGFSTLVNPRPVFLALVDDRGRVTAIPVKGIDPRAWQPFAPEDPTFTPLRHKLAASVTIPQDVPKGRYRLGLWMPDASASLQQDPRYAVRVANRDVAWWLDKDGKYGINILGEIEL